MAIQQLQETIVLNETYNPLTGKITAARVRTVDLMAANELLNGSLLAVPVWQELQNYDGGHTRKIMVYNVGIYVIDETSLLTPDIATANPPTIVPARNNAGFWVLKFNASSSLNLNESAVNTMVREAINRYTPPPDVQFVVGEAGAPVDGQNTYDLPQSAGWNVRLFRDGLLANSKDDGTSPYYLKPFDATLLTLYRDTWHSNPGGTPETVRFSFYRDNQNALSVDATVYTGFELSGSFASINVARSDNRIVVVLLDETNNLQRTTYFYDGSTYINLTNAATYAAQLSTLLSDKLSYEVAATKADINTLSLERRLISVTADEDNSNQAALYHFNGSVLQQLFPHPVFSIPEAADLVETVANYASISGTGPRFVSVLADETNLDDADQPMESLYFYNGLTYKRIF